VSGRPAGGGPARPARPPRPAGRRRALVRLAALVAGCAVAAAAVALAPRTAPTARGAPAVVIQQAHAGQGTPALDRRIVLLAVGSDAGAPRFGRGGAADRGRADSLHLVVLDPAGRRGIVIGFPRDSYVPIPGHGTNKINAAMSLGGPALLIRTFEQLTGIHIDYFALTSFEGLTDMVNRVGGVRVGVDMNIDDHFSGANFRKGTQRLNGGQALSYARARKTLPGGDLDRSRHQGQILLGGLATFQRQVAADPSRVMTWLAVARDEVQTDLPFPELLRLALVATAVPPGRLRNVVVPSVAGSAGSASVVRLLPGAQALFARVRAGGYA
jgi:polyisoprenyl-teichoic acid--peptidoglycan teichoic acid transferase